MSKKKKEEEIVLCPVGKFFQDLQKSSGTKSEFFDHMSRARVEFLKAIRCLVDEKIEDFEKKEAGGKKKVTKIKVE